MTNETSETPRARPRHPSACRSSGRSPRMPPTIFAGAPRPHGPCRHRQLGDADGRRGRSRRCGRRHVRGAHGPRGAQRLPDGSLRRDGERVTTIEPDREIARTHRRPDRQPPIGHIDGYRLAPGRRRHPRHLVLRLVRGSTRSGKRPAIFPIIPEICTARRRSASSPERSPRTSAGRRRPRFSPQPLAGAGLFQAGSLSAQRQDPTQMSTVRRRRRPRPARRRPSPRTSGPAAAYLGDEAVGDGELGVGTRASVRPERPRPRPSRGSLEQLLERDDRPPSHPGVRYPPARSMPSYAGRIARQAGARLGELARDSDAVGQSRGKV